MIRSWIAVIALALVGCNTRETPVATKTTETAPPSTPAPAAEPPKETEPPAQTKKPGDNDRRIHQLRELEHGTILANGKKIDAWLMDDESKREEGMMWLTDSDVKDNQGMLFVFAQTQDRSFWMQNTLIPLDIIYIDDKGKVVSIVHGRPRNEEALPSGAPAQYVLELKGGRAQMFGIKKGTQLTLPKNTSSKDGG